MMATLCGSLWEPGVPCNMVSPWLHPALKEVLGGDSAQDQEILALMCAVRRASISALWIGAAIGGLGPWILRNVKGGLDTLPWIQMALPGLAACKTPWTLLARVLIPVKTLNTYRGKMPGACFTSRQLKMMTCASTLDPLAGRGHPVEYLQLSIVRFG